MPQRKKSSRQKKKKNVFSKSALVLAVLLVTALGLAATTIPSVLPSSTVAQRFPGDPNPLVSGKAYWGASGTHIAAHESAAGKSVALHRTFASSWPGTSKLVSAIQDDNAHNRLPWVSTKTPGWGTFASGSYDSQIDQFLRDLDAAAAGKPVWLTIHHEPENDSAATGQYTAANFRAMQSKVRQRMNAVGTKNIAFMPIFQGYSWSTTKWNINDFYVAGIWDAIGFDHYSDSAGSNLLRQRYYDAVSWIEAKGLPYAIGEFGVRDYGDATQQANEIRDFWNWGFANHKDAIGYSYFDSGQNSPAGTWELAGQRQNVWRDILKNDTRVMRVSDLGSSTSTGGGGGGSTADTTKPTVSITAPSNGATVGGTITVKGTASDNVGVKAVTLRVDNKWLATDNTAPYSFSLDTTKYGDGTHTIVLRVFDAVDNMGEASIAVNVNNATSTGGSSGSGSTGSSSSSGGTTVITPTSDAGTSESDPVPVGSTVVIQPTTPGTEVSVEVDGEPVNGTAIDTTSLTNGTHKVTVTENGDEKDIYISVKNPWPKAMLNEIKANPVAYSTGGVVVLAAFAALWFFRSYVYNYIMRFKDKDLVTFGSGNQLTKRPKKK